MRLSRCGLLITLALVLLPNVALGQQSDQVIAERVLGPQWKQLSRRAGMIFAGTVLAPASGPVTNRIVKPDRLALETSPGAGPATQLSFYVDEAIAGVKQGQLLTIHEWTGVLSKQRPMRQGEHFLIFLYPPSRLGLTSPVGGSLGQVPLSPSNINVLQLERAIRHARGE
jgi:hypothetical protein